MPEPNSGLAGGLPTPQRLPLSAPERGPGREVASFSDFEAVFARRIAEADAFYAAVHPEALTALADELASLASALATDGDRCRSAAGTLDTALGGGREGAAAGAVATAWADLAGALADDTAVVAGTVRAAAVAYRGADEELAGRFRTPVPRSGARSC